jgi:hypothetical protein
MSTVLDILRWVIAIVSVGGTLALIIWIAVLFLRKDHRDDATGNRH